MATPEKKPIPSVEEPHIRPRPVKFLHEKSASFRTHHADGAWILMSNTGNLHLNFYIEHEPMADHAIYGVDANGNPTGENQIFSDKIDEKHFVVVRDFEVGVVCSLAVANQIYEAIGNFIKIKEAEKNFAQSKDGQNA